MRKRLSRRGRPGKASNYIQHFDAYVQTHPAVPLVLYCRESRDNGNLPDQVTALAAAARAYGVPIVAQVPTVTEAEGTTRGISGKEVFRPDLGRALRIAEENGAIVLAMSTDRFIRSKDYDPVTNNAAWPTEDEFTDLDCVAQGVPLATILPPDEPYKVVHGRHVQRGQRAKGKKGGRPKTQPAGYKKAIRHRHKPKIQLMRDAGFSLTFIATVLSVPRQTIARWARDVRQ